MKSIWLMKAYYNYTGTFRAFSEGTSPSYVWVYEWVVSPNGNQTWVAVDQSGQNVTPVIFTKVAISFLALYNTTFAKTMSVSLERALPDLRTGIMKVLRNLEFQYNSAATLQTVLF